MTDEVAVVTGGAGFLGSHLCERLVSDTNVICIDNFSSGKLENIDHLKDKDEFRLFEHDVKESLLKKLKSESVSLNKIDYIYHLASRASPKDFKEFPVEIAWSSAVGTYNVLELAREINSKIMLTSTSEVYGDPEEHPQPETYNGNVNIRGPRACYDVGKRYSETLASAYMREYNMDIRTVRPFNTYGPRMRKDDGRVIPNFVTQAMNDQPLTVYGDGDQTRSFLYVSDQIEAMVRIMENSELSGEVVNIGSTREITILELAETIQNLFDTSSEIKHLPLPEDDPKRRKPDISKAKDLLGWQPTTELRDGLQRTASSFRNQ